jgi:hypothetical protein
MTAALGEQCDYQIARKSSGAHESERAEPVNAEPAGGEA